MVVVGIDPGARCGLAVVRGRRLVSVQTVNGDNLQEIVGWVREIVRLKKAEEERGRQLAVVIELQYQPRLRKNPKSLETLYRRRHTWEVLLALYEITAHQVWPATWQSQLKCSNRYDQHGNTRSTKSRSIEVARFFWGDDAVKDSEQADAALIARWFATTNTRLFP